MLNDYNNVNVKRGYMLLPLQQGILYGPINSRRLGQSLGVNLMPCNYKLCSYNCVYCHYGLTNVLTCNVTQYAIDIPKIEEVLDEIEKAVRSSLAFDYLTFSGNGEPTLHPDFYEIIKGIARLRDTYRPEAKIALLSNSSSLKIEGVQKALALIDLPVFKLDAGNAEMFKKINRPTKDIAFEEIVRSLVRIEKCYVQTVLMDGNPSNSVDEELCTYFDTIAHIKPTEVQIYSLDRPVPNTEIRRVVPDALEKIAKRGSKETKVPFRAFYL